MHQISDAFADAVSTYCMANLSEDYTVETLPSRDLVCCITGKFAGMTGKAHYEGGKVHISKGRKTIEQKVGRYLQRIVDLFTIDCYGLPYYGRILSNMKQVIEAGLDANEMLESGFSSYFKKLHGRDIIHAYANGTGGSSCMTGDDADKVELFDNCNVSLIVATHPKTAAKMRALLWEDVDGNLILDRAYGDLSLIVALRIYGKSVGWIVRRHNGVYALDGPPMTKKPHVVEIDYSEEEIFPYLDTFRFVSRRCDKLCTHCTSTEYHWMANDCEGNLRKIDHNDSRIYTMHQPTEENENGTSESEQSDSINEPKQVARIMAEPTNKQENWFITTNTYEDSVSCEGVIANAVNGYGIFANIPYEDCDCILCREARANASQRAEVGDNESNQENQEATSQAVRNAD